MGSLISSVFGGSSQKQSNQSTQESGNQYADFLKNAFGSGTEYFQQGGNQLQALLGLGGDGAQAAAQANFRQTPGYQFALDEGIRGVNANMASRGLTNSGAAAKGITRFASGLADQTYQNYLDRLTGFAGLGQNAGQIVANAGQYSRGQSTGTSSGSSSSGGLGKAIGAGLSLISDRNIKKDITLVRELEPGINVYNFRYKDEDEETPLYTGLMAQEVQKKYPEAVKNYLGILCIDYAKLPYKEIV